MTNKKHLQKISLMDFWVYFTVFYLIVGAGLNLHPMAILGFYIPATIIVVGLGYLHE
jgi:hypothetical protein